MIYECMEENNLGILFRATSRSSYWDYSGAVIEVEEIAIVKHTPRGYWVLPRYSDKKRWVSKFSTKRFAYPTKKEALKSLLHRKKKQIKILKNQIAIAESTIRQLESDKPTVHHLKLGKHYINGEEVCTNLEIEF